MSLIFIGIAIAGVVALLGLSNLLDADDWPWYVRHAATFLVFLTVVYFRAGRRSALSRVTLRRPPGA